jgi:alpha-aminoadipic semialdehyde synthase
MYARPTEDVMRGLLGIRRETKSPWERRTPVTPDLARHLVDESELTVMIQPSARRVFRDKEYVRAGATVTSDLSEAQAILGVKEVPAENLIPGMTYMYFSHVIKGQPHNMAMLAKLKALGCTLIDYELVRDAEGRRLIFFGRFAGLAGMIDTLAALGSRLRSEGMRTPFEAIEPAHTYGDLDEAKAAVRAAGEAIEDHGLPSGLAPLIVGVAGYGNVARGVQEILAELPTREVRPGELQRLTGREVSHCIVQTTFKEEHLVEPTDTDSPFELQHYYDNPARYRSVFGAYLPHLTVVMNCNYWDERYPRLVTKSEIRDLYSGDRPPRLKVIGDLGCDIEGAVECTLKCTEPGDPVYVYDPETDTIASGVDGNGPVILAVDILPSELPREASEEFSMALARFLPAIARADYEVPFDGLELPSEIRRAVILHRGQFTPEFTSLEAHLKAK